MPRNGNRLRQRTSGSEAEERAPAVAVLRRQQESLCFDASTEREAQQKAALVGSPGGVASQKRKADEVDAPEVV